MVTEAQVATFAGLTGCPEDEVIFSDMTIEEFLEARGEAHEIQETEAGRLYVWRAQQAKPGLIPGRLTVMDFGDARLCRFTGEERGRALRNLIPR